MSFEEKMQEKVWSPWAAGFLLGLTAIASYVLVDKTIGSSGGIESIDSILLKTFHVSLANSLYFKFQMPPVVSFQIILFIGMLLGAFVSSKWSKDFKLRTMPDQQWTQNFGPSKLKRWLLIFIGGIIIEYSAGIAGGCTSGLAISGTMQLSPAGLIFIAGLFASGIITTKLLYGGDY
ncbi:YeeE/YedE thiosulfate transporter family protein [Desulfosporosinus sp. PR]|uniref:YeeE/YedE thiosulfate transporter family protein n=1 Tax=Candidatus Desulfosporosinus nitrosoreducens TaxID=3401928 RepID=UPI0027F3B614|nr:YeeE/YedE thiosulfate transporter family protein [Desulfosporosinus sp. PR]MDQ7095879.1 YeeE/YedE thiosulfate transporter family protein [Desulfosporosinus sp. PR]